MKDLNSNQAQHEIFIQKDGCKTSITFNFEGRSIQDYDGRYIDVFTINSAFFTATGTPLTPGELKEYSRLFYEMVYREDAGESPCNPQEELPF